MPYLYLAVAVLFIASASVLGGFYNKRTKPYKDSSSLYTLIATSTAFLFWTILFLIEMRLNVKVLWYSLLFGGCYAVVNVSLINSLKHGSVGLTSLFLQLSLIGTTVWGFFFWNTPFTLFVGVGLVLVILAVWLCLYEGRRTNENKKITLKWIIFVALTFFSNAGCAIVQKTQQMAFNGEYGNFFMFGATGISVIVCLVFYLRSDRGGDLVVLKKNAVLPICAGVFNGLQNLLVIILASSILSPSLIYPVLCVGGLMITTLSSFFVFKEKMKWWQWLGVLIGTCACGILSI